VKKLKDFRKFEKFRRIEEKRIEIKFYKIKILETKNYFLIN
jgi:hypothetical protein